MKIVFDHINGWGKVSDQDVIVSYPHGELQTGDRVTDVLDQGWIPWDDKWYNIRSVRINVSEYKPSKTVLKLSKGVNAIFHYWNDIDEEAYKEVFEKYCTYRGFKRTITWEQIFTGNAISYYRKGKLIGFSCVDVYPKDFVVTQFAWDYEEPRLSLGKIAQMYEIKMADGMDAGYVYVLGGYESCCLYKSDFKGFEWWTGEEWSRDVSLYRTLCERDDRIILKNAHDL